jgi:fatty-acyl-CoA synthase
MIYFNSLDRAFRYYTQRTALVVDGAAVSFKALHERVQNIVAALAVEGFEAGDRLALLLPNSSQYIELVYACSWLGLTAVPINARLSAAEIDSVLLDAKPRGLVGQS